MKKFTIFLLTLIILLNLSACSKKPDSNISSDNNIIISSNHSSEIMESTTSKNNVSKNSSKQQSNSSKNNANLNENTKSDISNSSSTADYKDLVCREISYYSLEEILIENTQNKIKLFIRLPNDWKLTKSSKNTINILRSGKKIGFLTTSALPKYDEEYDAVSFMNNGSDAMAYTARKKVNKKDVFYRVFSFSSVVNEKFYSTNLQIDYTEIDDVSTVSIVDTANIILPSAEIPPLSKTNGSNQILILGNSFINTSQIGGFINDMFNTSDSNFSATAISRGMAHAEDYAEDVQICNSIKSGKYSYLFLCGFYVYKSIPSLYTFKELCKASNTQLVMFPAHNENESIIERALSEHSDVPILSWKNEIDILIDSGVSYSDFCINDSHKHSTPLAGYVGAHMIYRTIFNNTPPSLSYGAPLTNDYVTSKLEYYVSSGGKTAPENIKKYQIN